MLRYWYIPALLLAVFSGACAQQDPASLPMAEGLTMPLFMLASLDQMPAIAKNTSNGIFVIRHAVLVKYDATTLQQQGMLELLGPVPAWDKNRLADKDDGMLLLLERARHLLTPAIAVNGKDIYITIGGQLFGIDGEKLKLKFCVQVIEPDPFLAIDRAMEQGTPIATKAAALFKPCQMDMNGKNLEIIYGNAVLFVNAEDGKIIARSIPPPALSENLITMPKDGPLAEQPDTNVPVEGKLFTTIGIVAQHPDVNADCWTVKTFDGTEFVLLNDPSSRNGSVPHVEGARVLIRGILTKDNPWPTRYRAGCLKMNGFLLLTTAQVQK